MSIPTLASNEALWLVLLVALLLIPPLRHLWTGWVIRRSEIVGALSENGVRLYFTQFYPMVQLPDANLTAFFEQHYDRRYGRRHYALPFIFLAITASLLLYLAIRAVLPWIRDGALLETLSAVGVAAVAGAYAWVVIDVIGRCRSRELAPADLYLATVRLVISAPLAFALTRLLKDDAAVALAFLLGSFPTRMLFKLGRRVASRRLGLSEAGDEGRSDLEKLQGITPGLAERFQDEGASTILQLAYADPIDLTIRANLSFNFVIDCVSQALAWLYFEDKLAVARRYSLRGAHEIHTLVRDLDGEDGDEKRAAQRIVDRLAAALELDATVLAEVLRQIAYDPYTEFNYDIWSNDDDDD
ncbi:MAG TPA: hypothetical protein VGQ77_04830 [Methylomirabilota bacterium]|jgi:hypothetical protein|nr:hypothetical protein [Methylomirabilota bacterium]